MTYQIHEFFGAVLFYSLETNNKRRFTSSFKKIGVDFSQRQYKERSWEQRDLSYEEWIQTESNCYDFEDYDIKKACLEFAKKMNIAFNMNQLNENIVLNKMVEFWINNRGW